MKPFVIFLCHSPRCVSRNRPMSTSRSGRSAAVASVWRAPLVATSLIFCTSAGYCSLGYSVPGTSRSVQFASSKLFCFKSARATTPPSCAAMLCGVVCWLVDCHKPPLVPLVAALATRDVDGHLDFGEAGACHCLCRRTREVLANACAQKSHAAHKHDLLALRGDLERFQSSDVAVRRPRARRAAQHLFVFDP